VGKAKVAEAALQEARATIQKLSDANQALSQIVSKRGEGQQGDESLFAEIEAIGKALEQSQKEGQRLSKLVAEREDEKAKLLHDVCLVLHMYFTNVKKKIARKVQAGPGQAHQRERAAHEKAGRFAQGGRSASRGRGQARGSREDPRATVGGVRQPAGGASQVAGGGEASCQRSVRIL